MTTTVKINAHCASNKEVEIILDNTRHGGSVTTAHIQDGMEHELVVYDEMQVSVREILKSKYGTT